MRAKRLGQMKPLVNDQPFERQKRKDHGPWLEYLHGLEYLQQTGEAKPQTVVKYPQCLQHTRQIAKMQEQILGETVWDSCPRSAVWTKDHIYGPIRKKECNHRGALPVMPKDTDNLLRSMEWSTVSKAALISQSVSRVTSPKRHQWEASPGEFW